MPESSPLRSCSTVLRLQRGVLERIARDDDLQSVLDDLCLLAERTIPSSVAAILLADPATGRLRCTAGPHVPPDVARAIEYGAPESRTARPGVAACTGATAIVEDVRSDERWLPFAELAGIRACWSFPVRAAHGRVIGSLDVAHGEPRGPAPLDLEILESAALLASVALDRSAASVRAAAELKQKDALYERRLREDHKLKAVGTLASGLAHDLNNLLTAIYGSLDLAQLELGAGHTAAHHLDTIRTAATQASGVCRSLLAFARKSSPERTIVDLCRLVQDSCSVLRRLVPATLEMRFELAPEPIHVSADPALLQQVLVNLSINARDAMRDGGTVWIRVRRSATAPHEAVLLVEDTGEGMREEVLARIFEPFFTTKPRGEGTGLGLAIVHEIVSEHGGRIEVESAPGKGARFRLRFPAVSPSARASELSASTAARAPILVAEDNELVRELLVTTLRRAGYATEGVGDGDAALEALATPRHALAILDLDLPRRSGLACLVELRARGRDVPVIVTSGKLDPHGQTIHSAGAVALQKPFRIDTLLQTVSRCLSNESAALARG